jgi:D-arabinose 1-dehydrogenase
MTLISSYGINAFDTSAFYGPSEIILGTVLKTLESEYPRESYQLVRLTHDLT